MKRFLLIFLLLSFIHSIVAAQDGDVDNSYYFDEEWITWQKELIREGYRTIFDTDAYRNGDYYVGEDGRTYLDVRPKADEEQYERDYDFYSGYTGKGADTIKIKTKNRRLPRHMSMILLMMAMPTTTKSVPAAPVRSNT